MNMEFSSLVLMEKEKATGQFIKELGSFRVDEGAEYIIKLYYDGEKVYVIFDTLKDVEEWEYSAIFDLFDKNCFKQSGFEIEDKDDEYNPCWIVNFDYIEEHGEMEDKLKLLCQIIKSSMDKVYKDISGREEEYK